MPLTLPPLLAGVTDLPPNLAMYHFCISGTADSVTHNWTPGRPIGVPRDLSGLNRIFKLSGVYAQPIGFLPYSLITASAVAPAAFHLATDWSTSGTRNFM